MGSKSSAHPRSHLQRRVSSTLLWNLRNALRVSFRVLGMRMSTSLSLEGEFGITANIHQPLRLADILETPEPKEPLLAANNRDHVCQIGLD